MHRISWWKKEKISIMSIAIWYWYYMNINLILYCIYIYICWFVGGHRVQCFGGLNAVKTNFRVFLFVVMYDTFTHCLIMCEVYTAFVSLWDFARQFVVIFLSTPFARRYNYKEDHGLAGKFFCTCKWGWYVISAPHQSTSGCSKGSPC